ncbi:MAG: FAD-binding protein [Limnochordaceae bacterium]|nr:FAD-binding protein [Limnochordaceae bacterium]
MGIVERLRRIYGPERMVTDLAALRVYETDGLASERQMPLAVVFPREADEVAATVRACFEDGVAFVARGSGTSLSGGSVPPPGGVVIALNRMNRILRLDPDEQRAVVEPGVVNAHLSQAAAPYGLYYAPDPSSQVICTLGGNVAFNSGGAHCLKYGMTSNHVLGLRVVLPDGTVERLGGSSLEVPGPDLVGLFVGSEGLMGVAVEITVRLLPKPEAVRTLLAAYGSLQQAGEAVAAVVESGLLPAAMEIMDRLAIEAAEAAVHANYPKGAGALLIVELDGPRDEVESDFVRLHELIRRSGATEVRVASDDAERLKIWKGRKGAFSAVGRLSPAYLVQDGVVPRTRLGEALREIEQLAAAAGLRVANVFHAGDGNLHPLILYDGRKHGERERAEELAAAILRVCIRQGGSITGEHGVGLEKRQFLGEMFAEGDLRVMARLRREMDPLGIANRGKMFPPGFEEAGEAGRALLPSAAPG